LPSAQTPAPQPQAAATPQATTARPDAPDAKLPADAASPNGEEVDEDEVVRVDSNLVIIPASVVDSRGRAVVDLKVEDFELRIDGEVKAIGDLSRAETPVHVALLFDNSASLSAAREFEKQAAVRFFRSVVRPIDRAAVYSISTTPTLAQGLTNDVPRLVRTIEGFGAPDGATALFDALTQAADYMRPLVGRKVLVLVSDGTDTVSDASFDDAVNRALRAECQVYVVQTRQVEDPNLHDPVSEQRMLRLSEQTGGAVFIPKSVDELDSVFTQISLDLSQQYLLSYYPQDERKDKYFRFISLRVKTRPSLRVRARKGFYPEAARASQGATQRGTQFSGSLSSAPGSVRAAAAPNDIAATYRRTADTGGEPLATRRATPAARTKQGPDGPDTEEGATPRPAADDTTPTFTLTASGPAGGGKASNAALKSEAGREMTAANAPAGMNSPTPAAPATAAQPMTASSPTTTPSKAEAAPATADAGAAGGERRDAKAPVSGGVLNGKAVSLPRPTYPPAAKSSGAWGKVVVEVTIDEQGRIIEARAISGHPFLQPAAVQAARMARFEPARLSGQPVKIKGTINYVFTRP
jgi:Ca-activated chloride channel family protein